MKTTGHTFARVCCIWDFPFSSVLFFSCFSCPLHLLRLIFVSFLVQRFNLAYFRLMCGKMSGLQPVLLLFAAEDTHHSFLHIVHCMAPLPSFFCSKTGFRHCIVLLLYCWLCDKIDCVPIEIQLLYIPSDIY